MSSSIDTIYERMKDDTEEVQDEKPGVSEIRKFYACKSLFLTGATGFMGKVFVEKLLRECPDLKRLYVMVRQKNGVTPEEKMKKFFQHFIFDRLRSINPNFEEKVVLIKGDLEEEKLGISESDRNILINDVDIIVHSGANVKFNEVVSVTLRSNILATKDMLDLAMDCKRIQVFMYVSTAYSHCYMKEIEEKFYDPPGDLKMVNDIIAADKMSKDGVSKEAIKMLLGKWPNVYTFTKAIAEDLIRQYSARAHFACGVYRPSIVTAAFAEPSPGWVGNNNGPALLFTFVGLGGVHTSYYYGENFDLIPVDLSINALLAAIYDLPQRREIEKSAVMYNYGSSTLNPINLMTMFKYVTEEAPNIGSMHQLWHPFFVFCNRKWVFYIFHIILHFIPAVIADIFLLVKGKKPRALSFFMFATRNMDVIYYFGNTGWRIYATRMMEVCDKLNDTDRKLFYFDIRNLNWQDFTVIYMRGGRLHILKEPFDNIPEAKRHFRFLQAVHYITVTLFSLIILYYVIRILSSLFSAFF